MTNGLQGTIAAGPIELRRRSIADNEQMLAAIRLSLEHLRPWMPWAAQPPTDQTVREVAERSIRQWDADEEYGLGMYEVDTGELVGASGLHRRVGPGGIEIGYWVRADRTGRGYAKAAAAALTRAAMALDGMERVEIHCDQANVASAAVPRALGFRLDRVTPDKVSSPGDIGQEMVWVLHKEELPGSVAGILGL